MLLFTLCALGFAFGVALMLGHRRAVDQAISDANGPRGKRFELRKFRRRSLVGSLIASMGIMLAGLYWVTSPPVFSAFILMILCLIAGILIIAIVDFCSVSIHTLTDTRAADPKDLLTDYMQRKKTVELNPSDDAES
jgi:hypothetical protein